MRTRMRSATLPLLLIAALLAAPSCIFNPKPDDEPPVVKPVEWPDLTDKEDVIETMVLCYENRKNAEAITRYEGLLHSQYFFAFDERDYDPPESPIMTRADDIEQTRLIFELLALLELEIAQGVSWDVLADIDGQPCEDCWTTRREYGVRAQKVDDATILQSNPGSAAVTIVVAPDESDPAKWVIRAIYDEYN